MKKLPIGIQSIDKILGQNEYVYVDKTSYIKHLIDGDSPHYFISRPRRFGKSLFISTLKEIFQGNKELFKTCQIYQTDYDWQTYPILRIDFSRVSNRNPELFEAGLKELLISKAKSCGFSIQGVSMQSLLASLIKGLTQDARLIVLVDEYDHPIINNLDHVSVAEQNRNLLKEFYATLKSSDEYINFTFITGVSKFSQVSLFSGPNYLTDITMDEEYSCMLGYTEDEIKKNFAEHIKYIVNKQECSEDALLEKLKLWYNGYRFSKDISSVYNPFSTLNFMKSGNTEGYWYSTGTPSFLIEQIKNHPKEAAPLSGVTALKSDLMDISNLEQVDITALMYQTGYLTVQDYRSSGLYHLGFPNEEVKQAFMGSLVKHFVGIVPGRATKYQELLEKNDLRNLFEKIHSLFASFPYHLFTKANEATYQGMLLALLKGMGFDVHAEYLTNLGRIDLILETADTSYIIECKLDLSAKQAVTQIEEKRYFELLVNQGKNIGLLGINFLSKDRNIGDWSGKLLSADGKFLKELN